MEVKCEYCGSLIPDDATHCPNCGAPNVNMHRAAKGVPSTIAELEQWYKDRNLPPYEVTRFFIGINYKGPRAYGIYQEDDTFIVYKNKADGTRAIRYKGKDEDYAVNELYLKLKSEILNQKSRAASRSAGADPESTKKKSTLKDLGFDKSWLANVLKLLGIIGGGGLGIFLLVKAFQSGAWITLIIGVFLSLLIFAIGRKVFRNRKKEILWIALGILVAALLVSVIQGGHYHTPRYYWYNDLPYIWYDNDYYYYDDEQEQYQPMQWDDVPQDLRDAPAEYRVDEGDVPAGNISGISTSSDQDSWVSHIDFFGNDDDAGFDWDNDFDWDFGDTDWDSDW